MLYSRIEIEFDPDKDRSNRDKHGLPLEFGAHVIACRVAELVDPRHMNEDRRVAYGVVRRRLFVCVYPMRGSAVRINSVRKANRREQRKWQSHEES